MSFDLQPDDPHHECACEIETLNGQLATANATIAHLTSRARSWSGR